MTTTDRDHAVVESFLRVLPTSVLADIVSRVTPIDFATRAVLPEPEVSIVQFGLIQAVVRDSQSRQTAVSYVGASGAVGLMRMTGRQFPVVFEAVWDTRLLQLDRRSLDAAAEHYPKLGWSAAEEITRRYEEVLAERARIAFGSMRQRFAHHLLALTAPHPTAHVRQIDLARSVGTADEVIRRLAVQLQAAGILTVSRAGIVVKDPARLRLVANQRR